MDALGSYRDKPESGIEDISVYTIGFKGRWNADGFSGSEEDAVYKSWTELMIGTEDPTELDGYFQRANSFFMTSYGLKPSSHFALDDLRSLMENIALVAEQRGNLGHIQSPIKIYPLWSTESDDFVGLDSPGYEDFFGDELSKGGVNGESMQSTQALFYNLYHANLELRMKSFANVTALNYTLFAGFQWFTYSIMPHMIYSTTTTAAVDKYRPTTNKLTDRLRNYYPSAGQSITLEVYNSERAPFGTQPSNFANDNNYKWYALGSPYDITANVVHFSASDNSPIHTINQGVNDLFYVETTDKYNCPSISVPVLVETPRNLLWIKDNNDDLGNNQQENNSNPWESPDIWVNQIEDPMQPGGMTPGEPLKGLMNYVHVRVRNLDAVRSSSGNERLSVYYAKASTGLYWPNSYIKDLLGGSVNGDRINKQPKYLRIDVLDSNEEVIGYKGLSPLSNEIFTIPWTDFPNINQSLNQQNDPEAYSEDRHYCLLARIEQSENPPSYGMITQETDNIASNTFGNNTIAWRNITIRDINGDLTSANPGTGGTVLDGTIGLGTNNPNSTLLNALGWKTPKLFVANRRSTSSNTRLNFQSDSINGNKFLNVGEIKVDLGSHLFQKWLKGGKVGDGVEISPLNQTVYIDGSPVNIVDSIVTSISILTPNAWIGGFELDADEMREITVAFKMDSTLLTNGSGIEPIDNPLGLGDNNINRQYKFYVKQFEIDNQGNQEPIGGETYEINYLACPRPIISSVVVENTANLVATTSSAELVANYYWYLNGTKIPENDPLLIVSDTGYYTVEVEYADGCKALSNPGLLISSDSPVVTPLLFSQQTYSSQLSLGGGNKLDDIQVFPNPAHKDISIKLPDVDSKYQISVMSLDGKTLIMKDVQNSENYAKIETIDVSQLANAQYVVKIANGEENYSKVITISK